MAFVMATSAVAYMVNITPDTPYKWIDDPATKVDNNPKPAYISSLVGSSVTEMYKQEVGKEGLTAPLPTGTYAASYETTFSNEPWNPQDASITWKGLPYSYISPEPVYLLVKGGNHLPIWYIYDLTALGWDGKGDIALTGFWPDKGAISYIAIFDPPASVPLPAAVWLLGTGLIGLIGLGSRRRGHKQSRIRTRTLE